MSVTEKFPVGLKFTNDSDKIQLSNPVSLGESWTVETWLSLPSAGTEDSEQNFSDQRIQAEGGKANDNFGSAVAISGKIAIVGARGDNTKGGVAGAAYIFELNSNGTWTEKEKLFASDGKRADTFGDAVAIDGTTAIVGAINSNKDTVDKYTGAVYIFEPDSDGTWTEKQKLCADDTERLDKFGSSVAISGDTIIVAAYGDDTDATNAGAVYIFERDSSGTWTEKETLRAGINESSLCFGNSVAMSDDVIIVGAFSQDTEATNAGAAYIFERDSSGTWTKKEPLFASNAEQGDLFGYSVAISGDTVIVGAVGEDAKATEAGAAYIFERDSSGTWTETEKLVPGTDQSYSQFGYSVAIRDNIAIVGAYSEHGTEVEYAGAAYVFERDSSGTWTEKQKLWSLDPDYMQNFAYSVAISDNVVIASATNYNPFGSNNNRANYTGAAYLYALASPVKNNVLVGSEDGDSPVVIQDNSKLGTVVDGVFYDSGYNLEQLTPGWHHLTAVAQDTTTKFFIDGQKIADVRQALIDAASDDSSREQLETKIFKSTGDISTIGNNTSEEKELGKLAEVRLWNRSLSESEITVNSNKVRLIGNESGLTAYYPLNEATGTTVIDRTDNSNNGTVTGTTWWCGTAPIENLDHQVMQFDGVNDYIDLGDGIVVGDHFTEEAWIYSTNTDNGYHGLLGQQATKRAPSIWVYQQNRIHGDFNEAGRLGLLTSRVMFADTWNHLAVTYDGEEYKVYVNGEECFSKSLSNEAASTTPIKHIGKVDNYFKGQIAEVRIWNITRTREEIQANMHQRLTGNESDLVAYLPLNEIQTEDSTQKVLDLSSNNNHGTVSGATLASSNTLPII